MNIKKILKNGFIKSIIILLSGSAISQILAIAVSPIMTRVYTEEQIGEYTLILTAVSMFGTVICGRYDMSIVSENDEICAFALIKLSFIITVIASLFVSIGYTMYYHFTNSINLYWWEVLIWIFILLFLTGLGNILMSYNNRCEEYKLMTSVYVFREAGKDTLLVGMGILRFGTIGLLVSQLFGNILGIGRQSAKLRERRQIAKNVDIKVIKGVAKKHARQPLFSMPAIFLNSFSYSIINIFISQLFGNVELAYYSMSFRLLGIPLALISANVSKVFFEQANKEYLEEGNCGKVFWQTTLLLLIVAIPMVLLLMIFAPIAFEIFFGEGWGISGKYVQILAPMFGIRMIVSTLTPLMIIRKKQGLELFIQALFVIGVIISYVLSLFNVDINYFLYLITIIFSLIYIFYFIIMFKLTKKGEKIND